MPLVRLFRAALTASRRTRRPARRPCLEVLEGRDCPSGGSLDPTFGTGGITLTDASASSDIEALTSVAVVDSGKLLTAGYFSGANTNYDFAVGRYSTGGTL